MRDLLFYITFACILSVGAIQIYYSYRISKIKINAIKALADVEKGAFKEDGLSIKEKADIELYKSLKMAYSIIFATIGLCADYYKTFRP